MMHPTNCPLCRKPYLYDRVKKLHVDRYEAVDDSSAPAFKLLQKIAMASAESASTGEMTQAANEAQEWLASQTGENRAVRNFPLRAALILFVDVTTPLSVP